MRIPLICHWRGNEDFACAFVDYYLPWVSTFNFVLHGSQDEHKAMADLLSRFPIAILDSYDAPFDEFEKTRRLNDVIHRFDGQWVFLVDSDELVELPCPSLECTIRRLERSGASCLAAPMLQRLRPDGSLESPERIDDAFGEFPLCSENLYQILGSSGATSKYPLLKCGRRTTIQIGNHGLPNGGGSAGDLQGVTHHFKWRRTAIDNIQGLIDANSPWAESESIPYLRYLHAHGLRLPLDGAFEYSRKELFQRKLLRCPPP